MTGFVKLEQRLVANLSMLSIGGLGKSRSGARVLFNEVMGPAIKARYTFGGASFMERLDIAVPGFGVVFNLATFYYFDHLLQTALERPLRSEIQHPVDFAERHTIITAISIHSRIDYLSAWHVTMNHLSNLPDRVILVI